MPALYARAIERLEDMGGKRIEIDFAPFTKTARLLYEGPWVAERYLAARSILEKRPGALLEVTRAIIAPGGRPLATEAFSAFYQLAALKRDISPTWEQIQCLVVPTAPAHYTIAQLKADPIRLNSNLGFYTNFVNLLDLCAVAVPAGFVAPNMPAGVTFIAPAGHEAALLDLASQFHQAAGGSLGATDTPLPPHVSLTKPPVGIPLAVLGAHLSGLPLNKQLLEMGATLVAKTRTSAQYRFYALPNTVPAKPGLIRDPRGGASIDLEVWHLDPAAFGKFVAAIPAPLGIGKIELEDGTWVSGFLCEPQGLGWRGGNYPSRRLAELPGPYVKVGSFPAARCLHEGV